MYRVPTAFLLIAVALAGCTDDGGDGAAGGPTSAECLEQGLILGQSPAGEPACVEPPFEIQDFEDPNHFCVVNERRDRVHAPDLVGDPWVLGQWWRFDLALDGEQLDPTQLIYYDDQDFDSGGRAQHYMVGTPTREEALRHTITGENPMLGRIHRVLYSPHESGDHADMFHFPLCEGSSWSTMFFGESFQLTATRAQVDVPGVGRDDGFVIQGSSAGGGTLELSYAPAAQWFTYIDLDRSGGGTVDMRLTEVDTGYTGPAFFLRGQQETSVHLNASTAAPVLAGGLVEQTFAREDGADGPYDAIVLGITAQLSGTGQATLEVVDPDGEVAWNRTLGGASDPAAIDVLVEVPYQAGTWTARLSGGAVDPAAAGTHATIEVVSIYDRSGSV